MMRIGTLVWLILAALASGALFSISYTVLALEEELEGLNHAIVEEQTAIRVLEAEWSYLNSPARLQTMIDDLTELQPMRPGQILASVDGVPHPLPVLTEPVLAEEETGAQEADGGAVADLPMPGRRPMAPARRPSPPAPAVATPAAAPATPAAVVAPPPPQPNRQAAPATSTVTTMTHSPPATMPARAAAPLPAERLPEAAAPRAGADAIDLMLAGIRRGGDPVADGAQQ